MTKKPLSPGLRFFGNLVDLDCLMTDLKLVLRKTEEIEFPNDGSESLILDIFPDITRNGFIVTLLIALDSQFKIYCEILKEATGQKLSWTDLKGSALERFITYSENVCEINLGLDESLKQKLIGLVEVRNCIVHNGSSLDGFSKKKVIVNFSKQVKGVLLQDDLVKIEQAGCNECADIVHKFMELAYNSVLKVFPDNQ